MLLDDLNIPMTDDSAGRTLEEEVAFLKNKNEATSNRLAQALHLLEQLQLQSPGVLHTSQQTPPTTHHRRSPPPVNLGSPAMSPMSRQNLILSNTTSGESAGATPEFLHWATSDDPYAAYLPCPMPAKSPDMATRSSRNDSLSSMITMDIEDLKDINLELDDDLMEQMFGGGAHESEESKRGVATGDEVSSSGSDWPRHYCLDEMNSREYGHKQRVFAFPIGDSAKGEAVGGEVQGFGQEVSLVDLGSAQKGDFMVMRPNRGMRVVSAAEMGAKFTPIRGAPSQYREVGLVRAACMGTAFVVTVNGEEKEGKAGDFLVQEGESQWVMPALTFLQTYEPRGDVLHIMKGLKGVVADARHNELPTPSRPQLRHHSSSSRNRSRSMGAYNNNNNNSSSSSSESDIAEGSSSGGDSSPAAAAAAPPPPPSAAAAGEEAIGGGKSMRLKWKKWDSSDSSSSSSSSSSSRGSARGRTDTGLSNISIPDATDAKHLLENCADWDWNVFEFDTATKGKALQLLGEHLFQELGLVAVCGGELKRVRHFLRRVANTYLPNPYHNQLHGADVLQTTYSMGITTGFLHRLPLVRVLALLLGALCHDVGHPGTNNAFQIAAKAKMAVRYNDLSVLENFHAATAFLLLGQRGSDISAALPPDAYKDFRSCVIAVILSTDLAHHSRILHQFEEAVAAPTGLDLDTAGSADQVMMMSMFLKVADISHPAKRSELHLEWTQRCVQEFQDQSEKERALSLPISMRVEKTVYGISTSQLGFIAFLVKPLLESFSAYWGQQDWMSQLEENVQAWEASKRSGTALRSFRIMCNVFRFTRLVSTQHKKRLSELDAAKRRRSVQGEPLNAHTLYEMPRVAECLTERDSTSSASTSVSTAPDGTPSPSRLPRSSTFANVLQSDGATNQ